MGNQQSNQDAELYLEADRVRGVGPIHVATGRFKSPSIELSPSDGKLVAGAGEPQAGGEVIVEHPNKSTSVGRLSAKGDAGSVELRDQDGDTRVTVDASSDAEKITTARSAGTTTEFGDRAGGGRIAVRDPHRGKDVVVGAAKRDGSGELRVEDAVDRRTAYLGGEDGVLLLSGTSEQGSDEGPPASRWGGGELVIKERAVTGGEDLHVHATAEADSEYGVDVGNRPRIFLDGPDATLELGRGQTPSGHPGAAGRLITRDDRGAALLEVSATNRTGEITFSWSDGGTVKRRGSIKATKEGLVVTDSNGNKALRVTKLGEIETKTKVTQF